MSKNLRIQLVGMLAIGGLIGSLAASSRMTETFAQDKKAESSPTAQIQSTDEAKKHGWAVISMKDDWKRLFPFDE
jgi:hypothetical protein